MIVLYRSCIYVAQLIATLRLQNAVSIRVTHAPDTNVKIDDQVLVFRDASNWLRSSYWVVDVNNNDGDTDNNGRPVQHSIDGCTPYFPFDEAGKMMRDLVIDPIPKDVSDCHLIMSIVLRHL